MGTESGSQKAGGGGLRGGGGKWRYFGVGCLTFVAGFFGGGMVAVLVAKVAGALGHCAADAETGAPCNWVTFWMVGAVAGGLLLPTASLVKLRRGEVAAEL